MKALWAVVSAGGVLNGETGGGEEEVELCKMSEAGDVGEGRPEL